MPLVPLIVSEPSLAPNVLRLRARVSHSWLDHEILAVPEATALARWRNGHWPEVLALWDSGELPLAREFELHFDEFCAAGMIDYLPAFAHWDGAKRATAKATLRALHPQAYNIEAMRAEYVRRLGLLAVTIEAFTAQVGDTDATELDVCRAWQALHGAAVSLKDLFGAGGMIPAGAVLP